MSIVLRTGRPSGHRVSGARSGGSRSPSHVGQGGNRNHGTVEFRDVVFLRPFVLGPGEVRELQVRLGPALEFSVLSTSPVHESAVSDGVEHAKEHARGGRVASRCVACGAATLGDQGSL